MGQRTAYLCLCLVAAPGAVPLAAEAAQGGGKPMIVQGVDRYRVVEPMFECVRVALAHRGEKYTPAYIQGLSGAAFRVGGPCPCAPTCNVAMGTPDLIRLLGYEVEQLKLYGEGVDPLAESPKVVARVRAELAAGRPAIVWHAFTNAEWDVVCGYDEAKRQFLGRGGYVGLDELAAADETRPARCDLCPPQGALLIGRKVSPVDAREAEIAALEEAIRHGRWPKDRLLEEAGGRNPAWRFRWGAGCYEWWARRFRDEPSRVPDAGDRYSLGVYRSTHRAAGEFLREIAPNYPQAREHLERAAGHFLRDAAALDVCYEKLLGGWEAWKKPDPALAARMKAGAAQRDWSEPARRLEIQVLEESRKLDAAAMAEIEKALAAIGR